MSSNSAEYPSFLVISFAALIFVVTVFLKIPAASGYVHIGDSLIYLASLIIGPWAMLAGAIGEGLADIAGS